MRRVEKYVHHGVAVSVLSDVKGRHRDLCLCFNGCDFFKPGKDDNCDIAKANYALCVTHNLVAPVVECPRYRIGGGWAEIENREGMS